MSNNKYADYIIALYDNQENDYPYRLRILKILLDSMPKTINTIIVEQTKSNQKRTYSENLQKYTDVTFINKKFDGYFNKSWLYNVGARNSVTNVLLFAESDNIQEPLYYKKILDYHKSKNNLKWFICWNELIYLGKDDNKIEKVVKNPKVHGFAEGGLVLFRKQFFFSIGGYNEWLECLGGMDNDIAWRADIISNQFNHMLGTIFHYWHPKSSLKGCNDEQHNLIRKRNIEMYNNLRKNKNFTSLLCSYSDKIGGDEPMCVKLKNPILGNTNKIIIKNIPENSIKKINTPSKKPLNIANKKIFIKPFKKLDFNK